MEALSVITNVKAEEAGLVMLIVAVMAAAAAKSVWALRKAIFAQPD